MARTDTRFRQSHNAMLDMLSAMAVGDGLPSEVQLAARLGVSRTVIRSVMQKLGSDGIITGSGRDKRMLRRPNTKDRLPLREDYIGRDELEARFLDWVLRFDVPAGTALNITQLARQFMVPPHALQEFLASLGQSGLIERRARGGWRLLGFTADYAVELSEFRQVLELNAIRVFAALPDDHPAWAALSAVRDEHLDLLHRIERDFHDFSRLDGRFHALVNSVVRNRFVAEFQKVISLIFHYHYQWDKTMERYRNEAAIREHLTIINALQARDGAEAEARARAHLATSKETLLSSMRGHHLA
ncbi:GntR family transcriptional regulator [Pseudotabrizicola algicola]|uniref:GntR family transcriptional regulator n=1 Tax=Pseudotabrizicola algicola TaxID=2709381 RepID=A0A6B3RJV8_9RHOB|nr:GntR family transcriptional regulator [Pseudotabrizicola algicola]NEX46294.1 GntR family transcriptional regulator [Pseudotabrizicola algicola]